MQNADKKNNRGIPQIITMSAITRAWQIFKVWLHGFEIYQIFVVRAWKRQTSKGWYVLMIIPGVLVYSCLCFWLQNAATLDELRKDSGIVETFGIGRNCAAGLTLRGDDGTLHYYQFCERDNQRPQRVIGKQATVWSQGHRIPPFVWARGLQQLQVGTTLEIRFDPQDQVRMKRIYERIIKFFLPFVLIPLFRIWWVNRNAEPERHE